MKSTIKTIVLLFLPLTMIAQKKQLQTKSLVDIEGFEKLTQEVMEYRETRLLPLDQFLEFAKDENTIILDTRSESGYKQKHIKGAVHINFSDFTEKKLAKIIPSKNTRILIYCNNNIIGDTINFATKMAPLALNIPTFINLYGYGYENVYELSSLVLVEDKRLIFEGTTIK